MVWTLPPYQSIIDDEDKYKHKRRIYPSTIQYEPIFGVDGRASIYSTDPRYVYQVIDDTDQNKTVFNLPLGMVLRNVANSILLTMNDLIKKDTWSSIDNFMSAFMISNRLLYLGMFITLISVFIIIFKSR